MTRRVHLAGIGWGVALAAVLAALCACVSSPLRVPDPTLDAPVARVEPTTITRLGRSRLEPYPWLHGADPVPDEALAHLRAENAWAHRCMEGTEALQRALFDEFKARVAPEDASLPILRDGAWVWQRLEPGRRYPLTLRRADTPGAPETVLLDADVRAGDAAWYDATSLTVSPDDRLLAWAEDTVGRGVYTVMLRELATGRLLQETLEGTSGNAVWADARTLLYVRVDPATLRAHAVYRHTPGTDPDDDALVYTEVDPRFHLWLRRSRSGAWVFIEANSHHTSDVLALPTDAPDATPRALLTRRQGHRFTVRHLDDTFYLRTNEGAPNFRLVAAPVEAPDDRARWRELVPEAPEGALESFEVFDRHIVTVERVGGLGRLRVRPREGGAAKEVAFGDPAWSVELLANPDPHASTARFFYSAFLTPDSTFALDLVAGTTTLLRQTPIRGDFDPRRFLAERLTAPADDGAAIPISLVRRRDLDPTQPHPLYLRVYGAYGESADPLFSRPVLSLLDRGFTVAIAHVRGGGELGQRWHDAGRGLARPTTFTDLVACAEHLVRTGRAAPSSLFVGGGSAGGTAVAAAINLRPELFGGVVANVPFVDVLATLLDDTLPLTAIERDEWGDPSTDPEAWDAIAAWSPTDNVHSAPYPPILVTTGLHDGRVPWWEAARWVARLRAASTSGRPVLLFTDLDAGHHGPATTGQAWRDLARTYAFLITVAKRQTLACVRGRVPAN